MNTQLSITNFFHFSRTSKDDTPSAMRHQNKYKIEYYLTDGGTSIVDAHQIPIRRGMVLVTRPGSYRCTIGSYGCLAVTFICSDPDWEAQYLSPLPTVITPLHPSEVEAHMRRAISFLYSHSRGSALKQESVLLAVIAELLDSADKAHTLPNRIAPYASSMHQCADFMASHRNEPLSAGLLARKYNLSISFFERTFKAVIGAPPAAYLRQLRIQEACRLLSNTDLPLGEIAEHCGFAGSSYFTAVFKREMNCTPSEYRKKNQYFL